MNFFSFVLIKVVVMLWETVNAFNIIMFEALGLTAHMLETAGSLCRIS